MHASLLLCVFSLSSVESPVLGESVSMYTPEDDQHSFYHNLMVLSLSDYMFLQSLCFFFSKTEASFSCVSPDAGKQSSAGLGRPTGNYTTGSEGVQTGRGFEEAESAQLPSVLSSPLLSLLGLGSGLQEEKPAQTRQGPGGECDSEEAAGARGQPGQRGAQRVGPDQE